MQKPAHGAGFSLYNTAIYEVKNYNPFSCDYSDCLFFIHYFIFGTFINNCVYTEKDIAVPKQLLGQVVLVARDAYLARGHDKDYGCLPVLGKIDKEIVGPEPISNPTVGKQYYTKGGRTVEVLKAGKIFHVTNILAVTKHGISTIDSGPGPINFLIMKDESGDTYQIATVMLGINSEDLFLTLRDARATGSSSKEQFLDPSILSEGL